MSTDRAQLATDLVRTSHALHTNGWVANHDGNVSVRLGDGRFLVTPTALSKADIRESWLAVTDDQGKVVEGEARAPSEFALHLGAYAERPDAGAIIHAHPPYATAMACAGKSLVTFLPEAIVSIGLEVPITDFALPFGAAGAAPIRKLIKDYDALLLDRHGVITVGKNLEFALLRMELVEHMAKIYTLAQSHGGVRALPVEILAPLLEKRRKAGLGLAADRSRLPSGPEAAELAPSGADLVAKDSRGGAASAPSTSSWKSAGPAPAADAWSGGKTEGACSAVYGAGEIDLPGNEQLRGKVAEELSRFRGGE
jgi:L-fuculose-phosphate aldolase